MLRLALAAVMAALLLPAVADASARQPKPTIVLVHGAFADASGWNDVTERLQDRGYTVLAPANPLRGVVDDTDYIRSVLDSIDGPIVLVGHSYGGFVMTHAAEGDPDVRALVYVAAFAPAEGETIEALTALNPGGALTDPDNLVIRQTPTGTDGYIAPSAFREVFAADLPRDRAAVMAASQRPADLATLTDPSGPPAWDDIPSWFVVATQDHTIPPATQRFMAERAGARTVEVRSSHVAMTSKPRPVTDVIIEAATTTG